MKKYYILLFGLAISFYACKKNTDSTSANGKTTVATNLNNDLMLKLVNEKRASGCNCGTTAMPPVAALSWNDLLASAALSHSKSMNSNNFFSHTSLNGASAGDRITAAGYKWTSYGENIASGQPTEQAVFDAWMNSEGHCKNIMGKNYKEMGIARDGKYWTQDFGSK